MRGEKKVGLETIDVKDNEDVPGIDASNKSSNPYSTPDVMAENSAAHSLLRITINYVPY